MGKSLLLLPPFQDLEWQFWNLYILHSFQCDDSKNKAGDARSIHARINIPSSFLCRDDLYWKLPFLFNPMGIQSYQRQVSGAKSHKLLDFSLPWRDLAALSPSTLEDGQCDDNSDNSKRGFKGALCVACET